MQFCVSLPRKSRKERAFSDARSLKGQGIRRRVDGRLAPKAPTVSVQKQSRPQRFRRTAENRHFERRSRRGDEKFCKLRVFKRLFVDLRSFKTIFALVGKISPLRIRKSVVLPHPLAPVNATEHPIRHEATRRLTRRRRRHTYKKYWSVRTSNRYFQINKERQKTQTKRNAKQVNLAHRDLKRRYFPEKHRHVIASNCSCADF